MSSKKRLTCPATKGKSQRLPFGRSQRKNLREGSEPSIYHIPYSFIRQVLDSFIRHVLISSHLLLKMNCPEQSVNTTSARGYRFNLRIIISCWIRSLPKKVAVFARIFILQGLFNLIMFLLLQFSLLDIVLTRNITLIWSVRFIRINLNKLDVLIRL